MNRLQKKREIEQKIIEFILFYEQERGYSPTLREIAKEVEVKSLSTISSYVEKIKQNSQIKSICAKRETEKQDNKNNLVAIPMLGRVTAGIPILATQNKEEMLYVPQNVFKGQELFMLTVVGDSMINAGISDGDKIVVKKQNYAENGQIIVALIDNESATVKRFFRSKGQIVLHPENEQLSDMIFEPGEVSILGKVVGLMRNYRS